MNIIILAFLFVISLVFLVLAFKSETDGEVWLFSIVTAALFLMIGALLINEGIDIVYAGSYGFVANNTTDVYGVVTTTVNRQDIYTGGLGSIFLIMTLFLPVLPYVKLRQSGGNDS